MVNIMVTLFGPNCLSGLAPSSLLVGYSHVVKMFAVQVQLCHSPFFPLIY